MGENYIVSLRRRSRSETKEIKQRPHDPSILFQRVCIRTSLSCSDKAQGVIRPHLLTSLAVALRLCHLPESSSAAKRRKLAWILIKFYLVTTRCSSACSTAGYSVILRRLRSN